MADRSAHYRSFQGARIRWTLRILITLTVWFFLLAVFGGDTGRPSTPFHDREIWLTATHMPDGNWLIAPYSFEGDWPQSTGDDSVRILNILEWSRSWLGIRLTHRRMHGWTVTILNTSTGIPEFWNDAKLLRDSELTHAITQFVANEIIVNSPALDLWPNVPVTHRDESDGSWRIVQERSNVVGFTLLLIFLAIPGALLSAAILPPLPRKVSSA